MAGTDGPEIQVVQCEQNNQEGIQIQDVSLLLGL